MSLILIGYRGSGKTTVGKRLAERLRLQFADTDELIVQLAGKPIREIFADHGEAEFRRLESEVLHGALAAPSTVLSTGGGIVTIPANCKLLTDSGRPVIYLAASAELLCDRIHADSATADNRPALTSLGGGLDEIKSLLALREPLYRSIATQIIDASKPVPDIVNEILNSLPEQARSDA